VAFRHPRQPSGELADVLFGAVGAGPQLRDQGLVFALPIPELQCDRPATVRAEEWQGDDARFRVTRHGSYLSFKPVEISSPSRCSAKRSRAQRREFHQARTANDVPARRANHAQENAI
jgi:hypothetical protein